MNLRFTDSGGSNFVSVFTSQASFGDTTDPNRFYTGATTLSQAPGYKHILGYAQYNGNDVEASPGANWSTAASGRPPGNIVPLTIDPGTTLNSQQDACV